MLYREAENGAVSTSARPDAPNLSDSLIAVEYTNAIVRERWKPAILWLVSSGHRRFNALQRALPHVTHKMLAAQLRDLVRDGILTRWSADRGRRHVEYTLTPAGEALRPLLVALEVWGREYAAPVRAGRPEGGPERTSLPRR